MRLATGFAFSFFSLGVSSQYTTQLKIDINGSRMQRSKAKGKTAWYTNVGPFQNETCGIERLADGAVSVDRNEPCLNGLLLRPAKKTNVIRLMVEKNEGIGKVRVYPSADADPNDGLEPFAESLYKFGKLNQCYWPNLTSGNKLGKNAKGQCTPCKRPRFEKLSVLTPNPQCNRKVWGSFTCFDDFEYTTPGYLEFDCQHAYINKSGFQEGWANGLQLKIVQHGPQASKKNNQKHRANAAVRVGLTEVEVFGRPDTTVQRCGCTNGLGYTYDEEPGCDPAKTLNVFPLGESCKQCDPGFSFGQRDISGNYDFYRCHQNVCTCANGQAATGLDCHTDMAEICVGCDQDYHLMKNECKDSYTPCTNRMYDAIKGYTADMLHIRHDTIQPDPMDPTKQIRLHYWPDWLGPQYESKWIEMSDTTIKEYIIEFQDAGDCVSFGWIPHDDAFWKCHATWASKGVLGRAFPRQIPGQCQDNGGASQVSWKIENPGVPQTWGYGIRSDGSLFVEGEEITARPKLLNNIPYMGIGVWRVRAQIQRDTPVGSWPSISFHFERFDVSPVQSQSVNIDMNSILRRGDKDQIRDLYRTNLLVPAFGISNKCPSYNMDPNVDFVGPPIYIKHAECTDDLWSMINNNVTMPVMVSMPANPIVGQSAYPTWSGQSIFTTTVPPMNFTGSMVVSGPPPPMGPIG